MTAGGSQSRVVTEPKRDSSREAGERAFLRRLPSPSRPKGVPPPPKGEALDDVEYLFKKVVTAMTPMLEQYFEIKEQYTELLLFYRLGD
ncbi:MAG: hypothetical protein J6J01_08685, partial [Oscillospiraceae bacterium]|nr:hypothetical protein [Oscillospiraceae bacterium]